MQKLSQNHRYLRALSLAVVIPVILYIGLRLFPDIDPIWNSSIGHFYIVTFTSLVAAIGASFMFILVSRAGIEALFLTLAFASMGGVFFIHGIATPGILIQGSNVAVGWAARLSLTIGAVLLIGATWSYSVSQIEMLTRYRYSIAFVVFIMIALLSGLMITAPPIVIQLTSSPILSFVLAATTISLLILSIYRALQLYYQTTNTLFLMLILAFCWLIMAQISQYEAPIWAFSWWMYHLFMLGAYLITMIYLVFNYEKERSFKITRYFISLSLLMGLLTTFLLTEVAVNLSNQEALRWTFIGVFSLAVLFLVIVFYALVYRAQQILNARQFVIEQEKQWRTDMSNLLAHDLMSPLNAIILDLDLLKKRHQSESDADLDIVMRVNRIRTSSETMVALLFDMLNVERLESGVLQLDKQNLNLSDLINETVQNMRSIAEYRTIDLTVHVPPDSVYMDADKMIIGRVVQNLLGNALKFAPQGGKVSIRLTKSQDQIYIEVGDNGPGIPKDQLERIFEKFGQINHEDKQRGFGLGLAFCKLAVEAHEGKIQVENNQGTGTLFRCIFQSNP